MKYIELTTIELFFSFFTDCYFSFLTKLGFLFWMITKETCHFHRTVVKPTYNETSNATLKTLSNRPTWMALIPETGMQTVCMTPSGIYNCCSFCSKTGIKCHSWMPLCSLHRCLWYWINIDHAHDLRLFSVTSFFKTSKNKLTFTHPSSPWLTSKTCKISSTFIKLSH